MMTEDELRQAYRQLPPITGDSFWDKKCDELHEKVADHYPERFLTWPTITSTMFVGNAPYIEDELAALSTPYTEVIQEPDFGGPVLHPNGSSGNLIHQAYHLSQWERMTGQEARSLRRIVEFGGGYGAMALIVLRLGFQGEYQIIDYPELRLLQRYYLSNTLPDISRVAWQASPTDCDLLIACHSLSETPLDVRERILNSYHANSYLFVYHCEHESVDNLTYFTEFAESRPDYRWVQWVTPHLPDQMYTIGVR